MNDDNLKKFLKDNSQVPPPPRGEWENIQSKIKGKRNSLKPKALALSFMIVLLASLTLLKERTARRTSHDLAQIESFISEDFYFDEEESTEEQYSWF